MDSTDSQTGQTTLQEQQVTELIRRCEQDMRSIRADLREASRTRLRSGCRVLVTDARLLEQAARRL
jgi:hypothetical protein